jgi:hypothetical protein
VFLRVCIFLLLLSSVAQATELIFGPEFAITSQEILDAQQPAPLNVNLSTLRRESFYNTVLVNKRQALIELLKQRLVHDRPIGEKFEVYFKNIDDELRFVLRSPSGWYAALGVDPGVLEWTTNPMTLQQFQNFKNEIQEVIFTIPGEIGLGPALFAGGGHINVGLGPFSSDRLLLRNFVVDLLNHSELFLGVFNHDTNNAISPWLLKVSDLNRIIDFLKSPPEVLQSMELEDFMWKMENSFNVYTNDPYLDYFRPLTAHYFHVRNTGVAFCFRQDKHIYQDQRLGSWRMEIRAVRPQTSMDVFLNQIELIQKRVDFLSRQSDYLQLQNRLQIDFRGRVEDRVYNPPVDPQAALQSFYEFVTESGLRWEDHQSYLWPWWITSGELARFNSGLEYARATQLRSCQSLLGHL